MNNVCVLVRKVSDFWAIDLDEALEICTLLSDKLPKQVILRDLAFEEDYLALCMLCDKTNINRLKSKIRPYSNKSMWMIHPEA